MDSLVIPTLETERLRLRPLRASDFEDYAALRADPEVMRHLDGPWDRGRAWRHLAFLLGHWHLGKPGMWAVERKGDRAFVGLVGYAEPEGWPGFELAGVLARRFWGQGYATEAARAALDYAFTVLKKERVISLVHPENQASIRGVERLGERLLARIDHFGKEMLCYGIDRERWVSDGSTLPDCGRAPARKPSPHPSPLSGAVREGLHACCCTPSLGSTRRDAPVGHRDPLGVH